MSVATEIQRIENAKAGIKAALEEKGVTVPSSTKIDGYPSLVESIPSGGGGKEMNFVIHHYSNCFVGSGFDFSDTDNPPKLLTGDIDSGYVEHQTTYNPSREDPRNPEAMEFSWPRPAYEASMWLILEDSGTIHTLSLT